MTKTLSAILFGWCLLTRINYFPSEEFGKPNRVKSPVLQIEYFETTRDFLNRNEKAAIFPRLPPEDTILDLHEDTEAKCMDLKLADFKETR